MLPYHILVVDDEPDVQQLLRRFCELLGYGVQCASDGQAALDLARQRLPDLILMDIQMPRKTGLEAVRELRADSRFAATPIIAVTAHARAVRPADLIQAGFDHILSKPFELGALEGVLAHTLRGQ